MFGRKLTYALSNSGHGKSVSHLHGWDADPGPFGAFKKTDSQAEIVSGVTLKGQLYAIFDLSVLFTKLRMDTVKVGSLEQFRFFKFCPEKLYFL